MKTSTHNFYENMEGFADFSSFVNETHYLALPDDWYVVITDVINSTSAIDAGRYKQVNAAGVASIVVLLNAIKPTVIPYVFGGDGASACIPDAFIEQAKAALVTSQKMAKIEFDLELRVGIVSIREIREAGYTVNIGKYKPHHYFQQALFSGGGLSYAEQLIKNDDVYLINNFAGLDNGSFEGFECRWNQISSPHGETISLLVQVLESNAKDRETTYQKVMLEIRKIYGSDDKYHPLHTDKMNLTFSPMLLKVETRIRSAFLNPLNQLRYLSWLWILQWVGKYFMKTNKTTSVTRWGDYKSNLIKNTDYRKFDEALRMVMSGKPEQRHLLRTFLQQLHEQGKLVFGIHAADSALITCIVNDYNHDHVHFLDGSQGGYAMAAKELKQQLKNLSLTP